MLPKTALFCCLSVFACFGQEYMPQPLPQVEYMGGLPSWNIDLHSVNNAAISTELPANFTTGSTPRGHMIILQYAEQKPLDASAKEPESPELFYLQDNIWNESKRILKRYYKPPPNLLIFYVASGIARHNKVKVPVWKLNGVILDTKMPKGYRLEDPTVYQKNNLHQRKGGGK